MNDSQDISGHCCMDIWCTNMVQEVEITEFFFSVFFFFTNFQVKNISIYIGMIFIWIFLDTPKLSLICLILHVDILSFWKWLRRTLIRMNTLKFTLMIFISLQKCSANNTTSMTLQTVMVYLRQQPGHLWYSLGCPLSCQNLYILAGQEPDPTLISHKRLCHKKGGSLWWSLPIISELQLMTIFLHSCITHDILLSCHIRLHRHVTTTITTTTGQTTHISLQSEHHHPTLHQQHNPNTVYAAYIFKLYNHASYIYTWC